MKADLCQIIDPNPEIVSQLDANNGTLFAKPADGSQSPGTERRYIPADLVGLLGISDFDTRRLTTTARSTMQLPG